MGLSNRIVFEVSEPNIWEEQREFPCVSDLIDYLVTQTGEREEIAARFLRGVEVDAPAIPREVRGGH